jgi:hypothetical protein
MVHGADDAAIKDYRKAVWTNFDRDISPETGKITAYTNIFGLYNDLNTYKIADDIYISETADFANLCLYNTGGKLYKTNPKMPYSEPQLLAENVGIFSLSENEETVFIINYKKRENITLYNDGTISCVTLSGKKTPITDSFDAVSIYGNFIYYLDNGVLYRSDGTAAEKIGDLGNVYNTDEEDRPSITVTKDGIVVIKINYDEQAFMMIDGENFYTADEIREIYGINSLSAII